MTIRIEIHGPHLAASEAILRNAAALGIPQLTACRISKLYYLENDPGADAIERLCASLLVDPVTERVTWGPLEQMASTPTCATDVIEVAPRAGVTDIPARELARGMAEIGIEGGHVATAVRYVLTGDLSQDESMELARKLLCNETIQHFSLGQLTPQFGAQMKASAHVESVSLSGLSEAELSVLSKERLLSLDAAEMRAIQRFYADLGRAPTDVELETLAQTWSEHCVHKTFRAAIDFTWLDADGAVCEQEQVDGLLNQYIRAATEEIAPPWLRSVFVDDAGIVAFDDNYDLAFKVETHNHPSALEPFGGANTGIGGVVRDILGVSARPIATTDVLCFGPQDFPHEQLPDGILHPARIAEGVVAGIGDYGNKLGLPTVNGAVIYDRGYLGNPLVFCGCAGLLPHGRHPTEPQAGDLVVALGGRTGRDGLHGATFSSAELTHDTSETSGSAVQIGDPITEKGLIELIEVARDEGLYHAITDCGAGGFSSAIGEMGEALGVDIELTRAPLKYSGLTPWEIWLSEAQERLIVAVPEESLPRLQTLADLWEVELSALGVFTGKGDLCVRYDGAVVAQLPMEFLHDGLPRRRMQATYQERRRAKLEDWIARTAPPHQASIFNLPELLLALLADPTVASKEAIIRTYDHEVRGGTLVRPLVGPQMDGPSDAAVLKPLGLWGHDRAFALSNGINPRLGACDPYAMAISAVDEAMRNAVAVGADPDRVAILDNFCWGNPTYPDRLGALVRCCRGCYDAAIAYRTPFISGKDSLYNEFNGQPIPGTLLISAIAIVPDMHHTPTSALHAPGNVIFLLGETSDELGGSLLCEHLNAAEVGEAPRMPTAPLTRYRLLHQAIRNGWIAACHDLSEGGLAVALAEMAIAGRLGVEVDLAPISVAGVAPPSESDGSGLLNLRRLFSESNGRLLVEIEPQHCAAAIAHFAGCSFTQLGTVTTGERFVLNAGDEPLLDLAIAELVSAWKREGAV